MKTMIMYVLVIPMILTLVLGCQTTGYENTSNATKTDDNKCPKPKFIFSDNISRPVSPADHKIAKQINIRCKLKYGPTACLKWLKIKENNSYWAICYHPDMETDLVFNDNIGG